VGEVPDETTGKTLATVLAMWMLVQIVQDAVVAMRSRNNQRSEIQINPRCLEFDSPIGVVECMDYDFHKMV
jgi:hypothetical protein